MNKTILIIMGIACAMITTVVIRSYNNKNYDSQRFYDFFNLINTTYEQAKTGDENAISNLRKLLDDKDAYIRSHIISVLASLSDKESIPKIKEFLNDEYKWVRISAEKALKQLGVPEEEIQKAKER